MNVKFTINISPVVIKKDGVGFDNILKFLDSLRPVGLPSQQGRPGVRLCRGLIPDPNFGGVEQAQVRLATSLPFKTGYSGVKFYGCEGS